MAAEACNPSECVQPEHLARHSRSGVYQTSNAMLIALIPFANIDRSAGEPRDACAMPQALVKLPQELHYGEVCWKILYACSLKCRMLPLQMKDCNRGIPNKHLMDWSIARASHYEVQRLSLIFNFGVLSADWLLNRRLHSLTCTCHQV